MNTVQTIHAPQKRPKMFTVTLKLQQRAQIKQTQTTENIEKGSLNNLNT